MSLDDKLREAVKSDPNYYHVGVGVHCPGRGVWENAPVTFTRDFMDGSAVSVPELVGDLVAESLELDLSTREAT